MHKIPLATPRQGLCDRKLCQNCQVKHHLTCINIKKDEIISDMWYCPGCVQGIFAYNHFDDDDDFYLDMQYYTDMNFVENMKCDYYFEDSFDKKINSMEKNRLSLFHQNIKSLPKHIDEFELYLNSLKLGWIKIKNNFMIFRDTLALTGTEIIGGVVVFLTISETAYLILEGMSLNILTMTLNQSSLKLIIILSWQIPILLLQWHIECQTRL